MEASVLTAIPYPHLKRFCISDTIYLVSPTRFFYYVYRFLLFYRFQRSLRGRHGKKRHITLVAVHTLHDLVLSLSYFYRMVALRLFRKQQRFRRDKTMFTHMQLVVTCNVGWDGTMSP